ncbi:hypothetical protein FOCC_FOCC005069 [Frankliniella occidentalis]|nr:hypothetical protein FOCC_FOCC005069 [Frankliniella occidentalis]
MSFSNDEARRIQRDNERLLRRIVGQRARPPPTRTAPTPPPRPSAVGAAPFLAPPSTHHCSHAVNRVRRGRDIERENQILLKKIQSVKRSPSQLSVSRSSSSMSGRYSCG